MKTTDSKANCVKCGAQILPATALQHAGRCAPCSRKKWHDPIRTALEIAGALLIWPFAVVIIGVSASWFAIAPYVPGTRANFKSNLCHGWHPDWATIRRLWSKARMVYAGPVGAAAEVTPEWMLICLLAEDRKIPSVSIQRAINASDAVLSAYCVLVLDYRREHELLAALPADVTRSTATFKHQIACFASHQRLGEFVKWHRDRAARSPTRHGENAESPST